MAVSLLSPETMDAALRLGSAVAIGGLVGFDRGLRQKPAGLRTHALVALGAALMTVTGLELAPYEPSASTRVLQGVIAGVGFLGGGVILRDTQDQRVRGLTTAASIWIVAGLGMACGAGHWRTGLLASGFTLAVLVLGRRLEQILAAPLNGRIGDEELNRVTDRRHSDRRSSNPVIQPAMVRYHSKQRAYSVPVPSGR